MKPKPVYRATVHLPEYGIAKGDTLRVIRELPGQRISVHVWGTTAVGGNSGRSLDVIVLWAKQFTKEQD